jgi:hypothetical protein
MYLCQVIIYMKRLLFICFTFAVGGLNAQMSVRDSSIYTPMVGVSYAFQMPAGDMVTRFGNNSSLCLHVDFKSKSYLILGVNGGYFFGNTVKEDIFKNIANKDGSITGRDGQLADVRLWERGFNVSGTIGGMFKHFKKPNPNTGLIFNIGFGFIQHKIRIETIGNGVPQLDTQYKKGYDRLTNGFLLTENLGYLFLSNNRLLNFSISLECMEGFTQNRRSYNFDTMEHDSKKRLDILYGARIAWILPLYRKPPAAYYTH